MFGFLEKGPYVNEHRLADVMALLQVLALQEHVERSESGISGKLGKPKSSESWLSVASEHPEFFRANQDTKFSMSLVFREVQPPKNGVRRVEPEQVGMLLNSAIELHDRQMNRYDRWTYLVPIWVALIAGLSSLIGILLKPSG